MIATINQIPLFYVEKGKKSGLPVIFLHGFPFSHEMWSRQIDVVGNTSRAIAVDLRGHGESFVGDGQYTIDGHVDDLLDLMDHLELSESVLVGLSMGGYVALRAYERAAGRFRGLVLSNTRSEADSNDGKTKRSETIKTVKSRGSSVVAESMVGVLFAASSFETHRDDIEAIRKVITRTSPLSIAGTLLALAARTDSTAMLSEIDVPTLILVGEHDTLTPPALSEAMHERIRDSEMFVIPEAAHLSNLENPEFFNEKLLVFLKNLR